MAKAGTDAVISTTVTEIMDSSVQSERAETAPKSCDAAEIQVSLEAVREVTAEETLSREATLAIVTPESERVVKEAQSLPDATIGLDGVTSEIGLAQTEVTDAVSQKDADSHYLVKGEIDDSPEAVAPETSTELISSPSEASEVPLVAEKTPAETEEHRIGVPVEDARTEAMTSESSVEQGPAQKNRETELILAEPHTSEDLGVHIYAETRSKPVLGATEEGLNQAIETGESAEDEPIELVCVDDGPHIAAESQAAENVAADAATSVSSSFDCKPQNVAESMSDAPTTLYSEPDMAVDSARVEGASQDEKLATGPGALHSFVGSDHSKKLVGAESETSKPAQKITGTDNTSKKPFRTPVSLLALLEKDMKSPAKLQDNGQPSEPTQQTVGEMPGSDDFPVRHPEPSGTKSDEINQGTIDGGIARKGTTPGSGRVKGKLAIPAIFNSPAGRSVIPSAFAIASPRGPKTTQVKERPTLPSAPSLDDAPKQDPAKTPVSSPRRKVAVPSIFAGAKGPSSTVAMVTTDNEKGQEPDLVGDRCAAATKISTESSGNEKRRGSSRTLRIPSAFEKSAQDSHSSMSLAADVLVTKAKSEEEDVTSLATAVVPNAALTPQPSKRKLAIPSAFTRQPVPSASGTPKLVGKPTIPSAAASPKWQSAVPDGAPSLVSDVKTDGPVVIGRPKKLAIPRAFNSKMSEDKSTDTESKPPEQSLETAPKTTDNIKQGCGSDRKLACHDANIKSNQSLDTMSPKPPSKDARPEGGITPGRPKKLSIPSLFARK